MSDELNLHLITDNWDVIAAEAMQLPTDVVNVIGAKTRQEAAQLVLGGGQLKWAEGWDGYENWLAWGIFLGGQFLDGTPETRSYLEQIPGLHFAAFLNMRSGTILKSHAHPENAQLITVHLGLDVPDECWLRSDGEFYQEKNGELILFDGTRPHYAFNASDRDRLILHLEITF